MGFKLIIFGALWLAAIGMITYAAFLYFNDEGDREHEKEMYQLKNED